MTPNKRYKRKKIKTHKQTNEVCVHTNSRAKFSETMDADLQQISIISHLKNLAEQAEDPEGIEKVLSVEISTHVWTRPFTSISSLESVLKHSSPLWHSSELNAPQMKLGLFHL